MKAKRSTILALLVTVAIMTSTFAVLGTANAATPQTGKVTIDMDFVHDGNTYLAKASTTAKITTLSGQYVTSISGPVNTFNLTQGHYYVNALPQDTFISGIGSAITNATHMEIDVTTTPTIYTVNISASSAKTGHFKVIDVPAGSSVQVALSTTSGFNFFSTTLYNNLTSSSNETFNATVPSAGFFYANLTYEGSEYSVLETYGTGNINLYLNSSAVVSGVVKSAAGTYISPVSVVVVNTTLKTYQVFHFSTSYFTVVSNNDWKNQTLLVGSPGYQSWEISSPSAITHTLSIKLNMSKSDINYTYNLSSNPKYLNLSVGYYITNGTTMPTFGNSSVNSLYWQEKMDGTSIFSNTSLESYLSNLSLNNTANTININGYIYDLKSKGSATATSTLSYINGSVTFYYENSSITLSSVSSGFTVQVHTLPTRYLSGMVSYNYTFMYSFKNLSLTSSSLSLSSFMRFTNPVYIPTPTSNQTVRMTFSKANLPVITDADVSLYWKNMVSTNYLLNSSQNNTIFAIPINTSVSFNASGAYYNPSTGSNDYQKAHFSWYSQSSTYKNNGTYNATFFFNKQGTYAIYLNATSPQDMTNSTEFNVTVVNASPSVQYNISLSGKAIVTGTGDQTNVSVPQSSLLLFSAYRSSLKAAGYNVSLIYTWYLPSYTSSAKNVTYSFSTPYIKTHTLQTGYLNITSVVGTYSNVSFKFFVNDTTPPSPVITLTNATGVAVSQPVAGQVTYFSANTSSDPYYPESSLVYHWEVMYTNGTIASPGSSTYNIVGGSNNRSYIGLKVNTLDGLTVSLSATNPSKVTGFSNKTYLPIVDTSRLVVQGVYFPHALSQGSKSTVYVNVSNNGTATANNFTIYVYVNGKEVASEFYSKPLAVGSYMNVSFNMTPSSSGNLPFEFEASSSLQPSFYQTLSAFTSTHSVNPPAYRTPLIIGVVIAIIVVVGIVYYKVSSGGSKESKTTAIKKVDQKKNPPQKK
ncbi:hypothetical protein OXIME_001428 [Oxyplasma meridianum]|uniref:CARDB domain-containing protein n=1 Tax=Oxyplasma meridianum TaxID=3073602 RepID=A0AAX4NI15_9ARCH